MFIRHARAESPDSPASSLEASFQSETQGATDVGQPSPQDRSYNELRKLQRLMEKRDKEFEALKAELNPLKQQLSKFQGFFGGQQQQDDDGRPKSYLDKVRMADRAIREADPSSNGLSLTLEGAELLEQMRAENEALKKNMERMSSPQFVAEQSMFVELEGGIKEEMAKFFGEEGTEDNYPDFERVAIAKLKKIKEDPKQWAIMLRSKEARQKFIRSVIVAKMPKLENMPGWQKVETYSVADAKRDMARAEQMAMKARAEKNQAMAQQAAQLQAKARQRLLPLTLGLSGLED